MRILNKVSQWTQLRGCFLAAVVTLSAVAVILLSLPASAVDGFDLPGSDYANFSASSAFVCRNTCGGDSKCQAWTWVKPGFQGPTGRCYLKDKLPTLVRNNCCNSGARENILALPDLP
jgi:PAN domain